jgi:large-conductance mechanosensitive channel
MVQSKMKHGIVAEFKSFINRGSVVDIAVAFVMGAAFKTVIDAVAGDGKDNQVGKVGYEIPFNRHFYEYKPPRPLQEIDAELDELSGEIMQMLREVHS